jgi:hypothetical protein
MEAQEAHSPAMPNVKVFLRVDGGRKDVKTGSHARGEASRHTMWAYRMKTEKSWDWDHSLRISERDPDHDIVMK